MTLDFSRLAKPTDTDVLEKTLQTLGSIFTAGVPGPRVRHREVNRA